MAVYPISATIQKLYRDTLLIPGAPAYIDSDIPVQPVAVISGGGSTPIINGGSSTTNQANVSANYELLVNNDFFKKGRTGQTPVSAGLSAASTGATIYTVTAGKTFYCTGVYFGNNAGGNGGFRVEKDGAGAFPSNAANLGLMAATGQVFGNGDCILFSATTGQVITLVQAVGAGLANVAIWGWEE